MERDFLNSLGIDTEQKTEKTEKPQQPQQPQQPNQDLNNRLQELEKREAQLLKIETENRAQQAIEKEKQAPPTLEIEPDEYEDIELEDYLQREMNTKIADVEKKLLETFKSMGLSAVQAHRAIDNNTETQQEAPSGDQFDSYEAYERHNPSQTENDNSNDIEALLKEMESDDPEAVQQSQSQSKPLATPNYGNEMRRGISNKQQRKQRQYESQILAQSLGF